MMFKITFTGDRTRALIKIKEEASKREIYFEGTIDSGRFDGRGIVGKYWFSHPQEITIQIDQKPPYITENRIKREIQGYLEGFY